MQTQERGKIDEALSHFKTIVAADGGDINFESYDEPNATVTVTYRKGVNEECPGCVITPDDLGIFLKDAIGSRGVAVENVLVKSV